MNKANVTLGSNLRLDFIKDIRSYANKMKDIISANDFSNIPQHNINDIHKDYINKGITELVRKGYGKVRAKKVSKYTFDSILEEEMRICN